MSVSVPVALVVIGTLIVAAAALVIGRQVLVSRQDWAFECSMRRKGLRGQVRWQSGLMRYGSDRLRWFRAVSLRLRPEVVILRSDIASIDRTLLDPPATGMEPYAMLEVVLVTGRVHRMVMELSAASGVLAWSEAAPAGGVQGDAD